MRTGIQSVPSRLCDPPVRVYTRSFFSIQLALLQVITCSRGSAPMLRQCTHGGPITKESWEFSMVVDSRRLYPRRILWRASTTRQTFYSGEKSRRHLGVDGCRATFAVFGLGAGVKRT